MTLKKCNYVDQAKTLFSDGMAKLAEMAVIYVKAIDEDPAWHDKFVSAFDGIIMSSTWNRFEAVGRGRMHPELITGAVRNFGAIKKLTLQDQEKIFNGERFECFAIGGTHFMADIRELDRDHLKQMIDGDKIRNLSEQRVWIETVTAEKKLKAEIGNETKLIQPYVRGGKLVIPTATSMNARQLSKFLAEMM